MTTITGKFIAGLGIAGMLLSAAPMAMAHDKGDDVRVNASAQAQVKHDDNGLHLGTVLGLHLGAKHDRDNDGDDDDDNGKTTISSSTKAKIEAERAALRAHVTGGTVTAVNGSTYTVVGRNGATTTITTNGSTVFKGKNGTSSVTVGSHIVAFGTTTASSTPTNGQVFAAAIVKVFGAGWGHFKHWLHF